MEEQVKFRGRKHYGIWVHESSNEMVTDELGIEFPRFRIVKEAIEGKKGLFFVVRELNPEKSNTYDYSVYSGDTYSRKLEETIYWLNVELHRI